MCATALCRAIISLLCYYEDTRTLVGFPTPVRGESHPHDVLCQRKTVQGGRWPRPFVAVAVAVGVAAAEVMMLMMMLLQALLLLLFSY